MGKAKKETSPEVSNISIAIFENGAYHVEITGFEKLTPGKIDRIFGGVIKEWRLQQQTTIHARKKREREAAEHDKQEINGTEELTNG